MTIMKCDLAILGGGLAGCLIALALNKQRPRLNVMIIESENELGGNHIWSYFAENVAPEHRWLTAPLVTHGWSGYDVKFPEYERQLKSIYYSIHSERLDQYVRQAMPADSILTNAKIKSANSRMVKLEDGRQIEAKSVIDARGPSNVKHLNCGWQKFCGQMLALDEPHGITRPTIMDATVDQIDGYRFVYCLPFGPNHMFVEDTYYSDTPDLDPKTLKDRIAQYARDKGWKVGLVERSETGVLPVIMGGSFEGYWQSGGHETAKAGSRACLLHPLTSYSLPDAVRFAVFIAEQLDLSEDALFMNSRNYARKHWADGSYYRMLSKMLFKAAEPEERYKILQRFYTLNPSLISRFYSGQSTKVDKARILMGKPPVPIKRALAAIKEK